MKALKVYSWKPSGSSNFGDVIGPMIARKMCEINGQDVEVESVSTGPNKLLCVGSILQSSEEGDYVWGSGVNGKSWLAARIGKLDLTIAGVRGPISRRALQSVGLECPEIYGDPGLLFPVLFHDEIMVATRRVRSYYDMSRGGLPHTVFVPNLNDERFYFPEAGLLPPEWEIINTASDPVTVAAQIMLADRVVSSSLHGLVFADALGKEACYVASRFEPQLKYDDYFLGTGRDPVTPGTAIHRNLTGNVMQYRHDMGPMIRAFPLAAIGEMTPGNQAVVSHRLSAALGEDDACPDGDKTAFFPLGRFTQQKGWANPTTESDPKFLWLEKIVTIDIERPLALRTDIVSVFFNKLSPGVRLDKIRAAVDDSKIAVIAVETGSGGYIKIPLDNQRHDRTQPCRIKINFGADEEPMAAFGSKLLTGCRFSAQVRKVGASLTASSKAMILRRKTQGSPK